MSVSPGQEERPYHGSLLDLRTDGWVLEKSWPGLFDLYTRDGEVTAKLSPELNAIEAARLQGYSVEDKAVANIKGALALSAVLCQAMREGEDGSFGFQHVRNRWQTGSPASSGGSLLKCRGPKPGARRN